MLKKLFKLGREKNRERLLKRLRDMRKFDEFEASLNLLGVLKLKGVVF